MQPARFRQADFLLVEINNAESTSPAVSSGRSAGSFSEQRLVIEPIPISDLQQLAKVNPTEVKLEFQSSIHERNENMNTQDTMQVKLLHVITWLTINKPMSTKGGSLNSAHHNIRTLKLIVREKKRAKDYKIPVETGVVQNSTVSYVSQRACCFSADQSRRDY